MEEDDEKDLNPSLSPGATRVPESEINSLTLSLTPPLASSPKKQKSSEDEINSDISEHLSSMENDRSLQELEVMNLQNLSLSNNNSGSSNNRQDVRSILHEILVDEQFKSPPAHNTTEENSLNIFENVDLDDNLMLPGGFNLTDTSYGDIDQKLRHFEEMIEIKDTTIAALTQELDSFRELVSNTSSNSTSTTEYKIFQEECHTKLVEYHNAITHKDEQIEKLTASLQQSIIAREEMKQHFKIEMESLEKQLKETSDLLRLNAKVSIQDTDDFNVAMDKVMRLLDEGGFRNFKSVIEAHVTERIRLLEDEIANLKDRIEVDKFEHDKEIIRLNDLLSNGSSEVLDLKNDLEVKHSKEVEELRTYFEKKCADLERNYSEEIFSQQSRKMSGGSTSSSEAADLPDFQLSHHQPGAPGPDGDSAKLTTRDDLVRLKRDLDDLFSRHDDLNDLSDDHFATMKRDIQRIWSGRNFEPPDQESFESGGDFDEVVQSYERRLQEQVNMARMDIVMALEAQIQRLAAIGDCDSILEEWPEELVRLKDRFAGHYQGQILDLNEAHRVEVERLKEEHARSLERAKRRSLRDSPDSTKITDDSDLVKSQDFVKRQNHSLKTLLGELLRYFTQCEDELNNTLVDELLLCANNDSSNNVKRVHLTTPNFSDFITRIDDQSADFDSIDLKGELGTCLQKLKSDANEILALTAGSGGGGGGATDTTTIRSVNQTQRHSVLLEQLGEARDIIQSLESDRMVLEQQLDDVVDHQKLLEGDLHKARQKISELIENGHKEIVSEGYGEEGHPAAIGDAVVLLEELQEKSRLLAVENRGNLDRDTMMNMIEDLGRVGGKIVEEWRREREDYKQQIEAADKKYKVTCQFLEDQAAEREMERDEAQRTIEGLTRQLRDRERDRANCQRYNDEVEGLEVRLRELVTQVETVQQQNKELSLEKLEASDKINELRDFIHDLEEQLKSRTRSEEELKTIVVELESLVKNRDSEHDTSQGLRQYVEDLEREVHRLRHTTDITIEESILKQLNQDLCDLETLIDRTTKDLETLAHHPVAATATACSSPSEDMSLRDVVKQAPSAECEVPLQQLARLREKLLRHSRAEDAAFKRIRDLEMHSDGLKSELDECRNERDLLKKQISEHLVLITNLQIRLDEQRIRAEHSEKQANTSLEVEIYDLKNVIGSLEEEIARRDKVIGQLRHKLEETGKRLREYEEEIGSSTEGDLVAQMQLELESLRSENFKLKSTISHEDPDQVRRVIHMDVSLNQSPLAAKRPDNDTTQLDTAQISRIEKVGPPNVFHSLQSSGLGGGGGKNSTEKHVRFEDDDHREEYEQKLKDLEAKVDDLCQQLQATESQMTQVETELQSKVEKETELALKLDELRAQLVSKDVEVKSVKNSLNEAQKALAQARSSIDSLRRELDECNAQLTTTRHLLAEKDKVIAQMTDDSKSLHQNLEAIQAKLVENGNIVDLRKRLLDEQKRNGELVDEIHAVRAQLMAIEGKSLDAIAEGVMKELDYSQYLDSALINAVESDNGDDVDLRTCVKKQKVVIKQLNRAKDNVEAKLRDLETENDDVRRKFVIVTSQLTDMQTELAEDCQLIERLRIELDTAQSHKVELGKIIDEGKRRCIALEEELDSVRRRSSVSELSTEYKEIQKDEVRNLQRKVRSLEDHLETLSTEITGLRSANEELEQVGGAKNKEIERITAAVEDLERESRELKRELEDKNRELMTMRLDLARPKSTDQVPEKIMEKIRDLKSSVNNNVQMMDLVTRLTQERAVLEQRILDLEYNRNPPPFDDPAARANYLFAKLLRTDSYRKALVWQKRYLISLLENCQVNLIMMANCTAHVKYPKLDINAGFKVAPNDTS